MIDKLNKHYKLLLWLIPIVSLAMHWQVFNRDLVGLHVWRQAQTQTVINNFYKEDMNILHPRINEIREGSRMLLMEFPIMQWTFAAVHKAMGDSIIIPRVLSFIIGLFSVLGIFYLCNRVFRNKGLAALGAWTFNFSPVFYYYTVNPLPDNLALCCGIWSVGLFYSYVQRQHTSLLVRSALLLCLATLAKLPFIIYGAVVPAYLFLLLRRRELTPKASARIIFIYLLLMLPAFAWYIYAIPTWKGNGVLAGMLHDTPSVSGVFYLLQYNLLSALPELLVNYGAVPFLLAGFYFLFSEKKYKNRLFPIFSIWSIAVALYFLFEMNMISTVHDYYLLPFLPLIFLVVAYGAHHFLSSRVVLIKVLSAIILFSLPAIAALRMQGRWNTKDPGFNPAYYQYKNELRNIIPQDAIVVAGNDYSHFILLYYINRTGWAFDGDRMNGKLLSQYINDGAGYLFTDSDIDTAADIKILLQEKIFEKENLRVYKLK